MNAQDFRDTLSAVKVPTGEDPFQQTYVEVVASLIGDMEGTARETDDARITELIGFWIERFAENAYRELADSINKGYSHVMGQFIDMARARAYFDVAEELKNYREYGHFFERSWFSIPNRP